MQKKGLGIVSPPHFVNDFSKKMFLVLYFSYWPNFIVWLPLLLGILGNMCIATRLWRLKPDLSNQSVFLPDQKVKTKFYISWEQKEPLRWNKKPFSSSLKGFLLPNFISDLTLRVQSISKWCLFNRKKPRVCNYSDN